MAHLLAGRSGHAGHVGGHRLGHVIADERRRLLLGSATDLADHHDGLRFGVGLEGLEAVDEARAGDGIATDADAGGAADALLLEFVERLVGEGARPAHDADGAAGKGKQNFLELFSLVQPMDWLE